MAEIALVDITLRLALAAFFGSIVGLERELKRNPAGLKTHALVCLGACIFTLSSIMITDLDPTNVDISRIAAGIVTGVGFLGAGTIFMSKNKPHGLTTAANIWVVASLGLIIGFGEYAFAGIASVVIYIVLITGHLLESRVLNTHKK
jgi:putative Mg2+ transporter-C (MgtC) family protein